MSTLLTAAALAFSGSLQAETSPFYVGASQTLAHDSNVFRAADDAVLSEGSRRSDTWSVTSLFGGIDQPLGRHHAYGNASLRASRYAGNRQLDNDGYAAAAGLDWDAAGHVSGSLSAGAYRSLRPFSANTTLTPQTFKVLQTDTTLDALVRVGVVSAWTIEAAAGSGRTGFSDATLADSASRRRSASLGLRWRPGGVSNVGLALRQTDGRYLNRDSSFKRTDLDLTAAWQPSGASDLFLRLSPGRTRNSNAGGNEVSTAGTTGSLSGRWQVTGKLQFGALVTRETNQDSFNQKLLMLNAAANQFQELQVNNDNKVRTRQAQLSADYQATAKIAGTLMLREVRRNFSQTGDFRTGQFDDDRTRTLSLALRWTPVRNVQLSCELGRDERSAGGVLIAGYNASTANCLGQVTLQ